MLSEKVQSDTLLLERRDVMKTIQIRIDSVLASEYRRLYSKAFPHRRTDRLKLQEFIARFVEDRLREETKFVEREGGRDEP